MNSLDAWAEFARSHSHEFTIQYPPRREYFQEYFKSEKEAAQRPDSVGLYLHIPFCEGKCYYCNFAVDTRKAPPLWERYARALMREVSSGLASLVGSNFSGLDIGGGTPTRLPTELLVEILDSFGSLRDKLSGPNDINIETTPLIAASEPEKMRVLSAKGVSRISMGVQSFNQANLEAVNRHAQVHQVEKALGNLRNAAFQRINMDLIFGLPGQGRNEWIDDLREVILLAPESITTYDCLYRGKGRALTKRQPSFPSAEQYGELYDCGWELLQKAGYFAPYGSVNFSKRPEETGTSTYFESRLLDGTPYRGFGNYASSWMPGSWWFNHHGVDTYMRSVESGEDPVGDRYTLPAAEEMAKYLLFSLNYGFIDPRRFYDRFNLEFEATYPEELDWLVHHQILYKESEEWRIMHGHFKDLAIVRALFYPQAARRWILTLEEQGGLITQKTPSIASIP